jgi:hypothetical protein
VLRRVVSTFFEVYDPERNQYIYQEDNCTVHWSRHTRAVKQELGIPCLNVREWPSNSPDVAVADYFVWPWLMQHVRSFCVCLQDNFPLQVEKAGPAPRNADELEVRIRAAWAALPLAFIRNAIDAQPRRIQMVIDNGGGHIAKWAG